MTSRLSFISGDKRVAISALILVIFGSLMIASAEMGVSAGDASYLTSVIIKQFVFAIVGLIAYFILLKMRVYRLRPFLFYMGYGIILFTLILCRAFGQINGAYAWITVLPGVTLQPSEFAKVFMIGFAAKLFSVDHKDKNRFYFALFGGLAFLYFVVIAFFQHDFGSAIVLFVICYCMMLVPNYPQIRKYQRYMILLIIVGIAGMIFLLSDPVTEFMKSHSDNYMIGRFLAAADPFLYQYDNGYHLIMSLVSFANGGVFGLGYGNSIHKYMNFPNPSNDFILPVIVEELGIVGFVLFIFVYFLMLYPIITTSIKSKFLSSKIVCLGVFVYFAVHFILNVGGVSGLVPLTGVPLLMISSGGSSLMASLAALGLAQSEIERNIKAENENNSGKI